MIVKILFSVFRFFYSKPIYSKKEFNLKNSYINKANEQKVFTDLIHLHSKYKVIWVFDGDTFEAKKEGENESMIIRLDSIDCPEKGQEWGNNAKSGLMRLILDKEIYLEKHGIDGYGRILATAYVKQNEEAWVNVNERMVMHGHAWVMRICYDHLTPSRKKNLNKLENWAKSKKVGLWRNPDAIPPWEFRS